MNSLNHGSRGSSLSISGFFSGAEVEGKRVEEKDDSLTNFESQPRDVHRAGGRANICADIILGKKRRRLKLSGELEHGPEDNKGNGRGK